MAITPVSPSTTSAVGIGSSVYTFCGFPMSDIVAIGSIIFILVQLFVYTPKIYNTGKAWYRKIFKRDSTLFDELADVPLEDDNKSGGS